MKVSITGASISGLYLGYLLAREGVEVEVYEKEKQGQAPKRTLIVTAKIKEILDFDLSDSVINKINRYELIADGQKTAIQLDNPDLVIERRAMLETLARRAEEAGAKIFWGHEVIGISQNNRSKLSDLSSGIFSLKIFDRESGKEKRIERDIVVLANGLNANLNGNNKLALVQARVKNGDTNIFRANTCQVWLDARRTRYFFWLIPESAEVAAVGLIDESMSKAYDLLRAFLEEHRLQPLEFQAALVPEYKANLFRLDGQRFLLSREISKEKAKIAKVKIEISGEKKEISEANEGILASKGLDLNSIKTKFFDQVSNDRAGNSIDYVSNNKVKIKIVCVPNNGKGGLYAVGDAAAQVKMTTVGGVVAGLRGAKAVAAAIPVYNHNQDCAKSGTSNFGKVYSSRNSDKYKRALRELYWELNLHYFLRKLLNRFTNEDYARLLRKIEQDEELKQMLGRFTRDDLSRFLFKLLWKRPWLLVFALRKWGHILFSLQKWLRLTHLSILSQF